MKPGRPEDWASLGFDLWLLGMEASAVMGLRAMKLAAGGAAANREAGLMVGEKVTAAATIAQHAMLGQLGTSAPEMSSKAVAHYRRRVRTNLKRLSRS